jgi:hypothetical protein
VQSCGPELPSEVVGFHGTSRDAVAGAVGDLAVEAAVVGTYTIVAFLYAWPGVIGRPGSAARRCGRLLLERGKNV